MDLKIYLDISNNNFLKVDEIMKDFCVTYFLDFISFDAVDNFYNINGIHILVNCKRILEISVENKN